MPYKDSVVRLIKQHSCKRVAEIGILRAELAKTVHRTCQLEAYYLIDPWKPYSGPGAGILADIANWEDLCQEVYSYFWEYDEVHIIRLESVRAATLLQPESLDMVFIDADHTYEALSADIQAWLPIIRKGGVLAGHDYQFCGAHHGVKKAVDECLGKTQHLPGGVWYIEK